MLPYCWVYENIRNIIFNKTFRLFSFKRKKFFFSFLEIQRGKLKDALIKIHSQLCYLYHHKYSIPRECSCFLSVHQKKIHFRENYPRQRTISCSPYEPLEWNDININERGKGIYPRKITFLRFKSSNREKKKIPSMMLTFRLREWKWRKIQQWRWKIILAWEIIWVWFSVCHRACWNFLFYLRLTQTHSLLKCAEA